MLANDEPTNPFSPTKKTALRLKLLPNGSETQIYMENKKRMKRTLVGYIQRTQVAIQAQNELDTANEQV